MHSSRAELAPLTVGIPGGLQAPSHIPKFTCFLCRHLEALWFANIANSILWWAFVKVRCPC